MPPDKRSSGIAGTRLDGATGNGHVEAWAVEWKLRHTRVHPCRWCGGMNWTGGGAEGRDATAHHTRRCLGLLCTVQCEWLKSEQY
jgi:hypothetical protein